MRPCSPPKFFCIRFFAEISPPRRRVTFSAMRKSPKNRRGTAQDEHSVLIFALPPAPHYGGTHICKSKQNFRRAKSGVLGCGSFRATGPWVCGKLELVRFRFCACRFRTNVPRLFSAVGAHSVRPRAGLGPAPTQRQTRFPILRRGRCPHPPAAGSDPPVGAAISRPKRPDGDIGPYKRANTFSGTPQEQPHAPARPRRSVM